MSPKHPHPTPTFIPPPPPPPQTITTSTPMQGVTLTTITKTINFYPCTHEVFMADESFAGAEREKNRYLAEYLSRCDVRAALETERREFEKMGGQTGEVLRVWVTGGSLGGGGRVGTGVMGDHSGAVSKRC